MSYLHRHQQQRRAENRYGDRGGSSGNRRRPGDKSTVSRSTASRNATDWAEKRRKAIERAKALKAKRKAGEVTEEHTFAPKLSAKQSMKTAGHAGVFDSTGQDLYYDRQKESVFADSTQNYQNESNIMGEPNSMTGHGRQQNYQNAKGMSHQSRMSHQSNGYVEADALDIEHMRREIGRKMDPLQGGKQSNVSYPEFGKMDVTDSLAKQVVQKNEQLRRQGIPTDYNNNERNGPYSERNDRNYNNNYDNAKNDPYSSRNYNNNPNSDPYSSNTGYNNSNFQSSVYTEPSSSTYSRSNNHSNFRQEEQNRGSPLRRSSPSQSDSNAQSTTTTSGPPNGVQWSSAKKAEMEAHELFSNLLRSDSPPPTQTSKGRRSRRPVWNDDFGTSSGIPEPVVPIRKNRETKNRGEPKNRGSRNSKKPLKRRPKPKAQWNSDFASDYIPKERQQRQNEQQGNGRQNGRQQQGNGRQQQSYQQQPHQQSNQRNSPSSIENAAFHAIANEPNQRFGPTPELSGEADGHYRTMIKFVDEASTQPEPINYNNSVAKQTMDFNSVTKPPMDFNSNSSSQSNRATDFNNSTQSNYSPQKSQPRRTKPGMDRGKLSLLKRKMSNGSGVQKNGASRQQKNVGSRLQKNVASRRNAPVETSSPSQKGNRAMQQGIL